MLLPVKQHVHCRRSFKRAVLNNAFCIHEKSAPNCVLPRGVAVDVCHPPPNTHTHTHTHNHPRANKGIVAWGFTRGGGSRGGVFRRFGLLQWAARMTVSHGHPSLRLIGSVTHFPALRCEDAGALACARERAAAIL